MQLVGGEKNKVLYSAPKGKKKASSNERQPSSAEVSSPTTTFALKKRDLAQERDNHSSSPKGKTSQRYGKGGGRQGEWGGLHKKLQSLDLKTGGGGQKRFRRGGGGNVVLDLQKRKFPYLWRKERTTLLQG